MPSPLAVNEKPNDPLRHPANYVATVAVTHSDGPDMSPTPAPSRPARATPSPENAGPTRVAGGGFKPPTGPAPVVRRHAVPDITGAHGANAGRLVHSAAAAPPAQVRSGYRRPEPSAPTPPPLRSERARVDSFASAPAGGGRGSGSYKVRSSGGPVPALIRNRPPDGTELADAGGGSPGGDGIVFPQPAPLPNWADGGPIAVLADLNEPLLEVASGPRTLGSFQVDGGQHFNAGVQDIGREGDGRFTQAGADNTARLIWLASEPGSSAQYELGSGDVLWTRRNPAGSPHVKGIVVGGKGDAVFEIGGAPGPGFVVAADPDADTPLIIRAHPIGNGKLHGAGQITLTGYFEQNGVVVADGFGQAHVLSFAGFRNVSSTIENSPAGGANGWYATNTGRLELPPLYAPAGTSTQTWGENAADPVIDLVNSVRVTLHDVTDPAAVQIALLAPDRPEVPDLPHGHTFIGVWSFDAGAADIAGGVDLTVRYDDGLAARLGLDESVLKLWQYRDGAWERIADASFARDIDNHLLSGHARGDLSYFAVSAPEPTSAGLLLLGGAALLLRHRRSPRR